MPRFHRAAAVGLSLGILATSAACSAEPTVEIELAMDRGFSPADSHAWAKLFAELGVERVQIRAMRASDEVQVVRRGTATAAVYHVVGVLTARNTVQLPGGTFAPGQARQLKAWLENLVQHGPPSERAAGEKSVFGLSARQFAALHVDLSQPVALATKDQPIADVVPRLGRALKHPVVIDAAAQAALAEGEKMPDELRGLSSGTALAAALRPAGLIAVPRQAGGRVELWITSGKGATQLWPVGWTPEPAPAKLVPALVETVNADIEETPLNEVMEAIGGRLKVPVLYDHNALARLRVDLARTTVRLPPERAIYSTVLRKILNQARLKFEVRVDEAGKPFLWVSAN
jgi:hypothetical protein